MKNNKRKRVKNERDGIIFGILLSLCLTCCLLCFLFFYKLTYKPIVNQLSEIVIAPQELIAKEEVVQQKKKQQNLIPKSEKVNKEKKEEFVQKSESVIKGEKNKIVEPSTVDEFGDVEVKKEKKKEIKKNSLFPSGMSKSKKDSLAATVAEKISENVKAGSVDGNVVIGKLTNEPVVSLEGRKVLGRMPIPVYNVQDEGVVVVQIWVDQYGKVTKAKAGANGTTTTNKVLLKEAEKAAYKTVFNVKSDAPIQQLGTIRYIYKLK